MFFNQQYFFILNVTFSLFFIYFKLHFKQRKTRNSLWGIQSILNKINFYWSIMVGCRGYTYSINGFLDTAHQVLESDPFEHRVWIWWNALGQATFLPHFFLLVFFFLRVFFVFLHRHSYFSPISPISSTEQEYLFLFMLSRLTRWWDKPRIIMHYIYPGRWLQSRIASPYACLQTTAMSVLHFQ